MSSNRPIISTFLLGSLGVISFSVFLYFTFFRTPPPDPSKKKSIDDGKLSPPKEKEGPETKSKTIVAKSTADVSVEDVVDEDEDDAVDEGGEDSAELEALKTQYEDANRLAAKFIQGQKFEQAIGKLSEALDIAPRIPSASKDIMTLYNNRSAMYEKSGEHEKALTDITVVLTMDAFHMKARVRRARIFESKNKFRQALEEYVLVTLIQQKSGQQPAYQHKIDAIVKEMALKSTPALFQKSQSAGDGRSLPSKSHCRNFLESFPSMQVWKEYYQTVQRDDLQRAVSAAETAASGDAVDGDDTSAHLLRQEMLNLVCFDLIRCNFTDAFANLRTLPLPPAITTGEDNAPPAFSTVNNVMDLGYMIAYEDNSTTTTATTTTTASDRLCSLHYEMLGFEQHLRCNLAGAVPLYTQALHYCPANVDARLKLANVYQERGDVSAARDTYSSMLQHFVALKSSLASLDADSTATAGGEDEADGAEAAASSTTAVDTTATNTAASNMLAIMKTWTLLHRVSVYLTRDETGAYPANAIEDSLTDVDAALSVTEPLKHLVAGRAATVTALVRTVHILVQSKPMVGLDMPTESDGVRANDCITQAKQLMPDNESVLLMEAELLNNEGKTEEALAVLDSCTQRPGALADDCTPHFVKASIVISKAMSIFQAPTSMEQVNEAKEMLQNADALYQHALELEPQAIEVLNQYAQYCSMIGEVQRSVELLKQAIPLARTRDDVQDLNQLLILNEAQHKAITFIQNPNA